MVRPVFVSPHYDDIALSCGGIVALTARTSSPLIVTIFGGQPRSFDSDFARFQHERWGFEADDAVDRRRSEDACAARALGSSVETRWLDFLDAIYRDAAYDSDEALFGDVRSGDEALFDEIAAVLMGVSADAYYVPMALGNHVDHQIALAAGRALARAGRTVWAYPDVPYALTLTAPAIQDGHASADQCLVDLDDDALDRKLAAVACYRSQTPVIFRHLGDPDDELRRFALRTGGDRPAEALYRLSG